MGDCDEKGNKDRDKDVSLIGIYTGKKRCSKYKYDGIWGLHSAGYDK